MNISQISINGKVYQVRYTYKKDDGSIWYVLLVDGGFYGDFGDEFPVSKA